MTPLEYVAQVSVLVGAFRRRVEEECEGALQIDQVRFWRALRALLTDLSDLRSQVEEEIYDSMAQKEVILPEVGLVTRYKPVSNKWDNAEVIRRLKRRHTDDNGEYDSLAVLDDILQAAQIAYWRKTKLPFESDDEVVAKQWGPKKIKLED